MKLTVRNGGAVLLAAFVFAIPALGPAEANAPAAAGQAGAQSPSDGGITW